MSEHTKEPWKAAHEEGDNAELWIYNSEVGSKQYAIGVLFSLNPSAEKDASRIVACVNACAGISNEELELHNVKPVKAASDYISSLEAQLAESQRQIAELRDALNKYGKHTGECMHTPLVCDCGLDRVLKKKNHRYNCPKGTSDAPFCDCTCGFDNALQESGNG